MKQAQNFTEGKILSPLLRFALPVLLALLLQAMYGAADLLIVGRFGGDMAEVYVSAVSTGSQIMYTLTFVVTGLAMGLTVLVGRKIGAGEREEAGRVIGSGICLFGGLSVILTAVMILIAPAFTRLMQAPAAAFADTLRYVIICSAGTVFITAYNLFGSIFRGIGDSKTPPDHGGHCLRAEYFGGPAVGGGLWHGRGGRCCGHRLYPGGKCGDLLPDDPPPTAAFCLRCLLHSPTMEGYRHDPAAGGSHCAAGSAGEYLLPCHPGHRQQPWAE